MRRQLTDEMIDATVSFVAQEFARRLRQKGRGALVGPHEGLGIIVEEYDELIDAIRANDRSETVKESADLAVACMFGIASLMTEEEGRAHLKQERVNDRRARTRAEQAG